LWNPALLPSAAAHAVLVASFGSQEVWNSVPWQCSLEVQLFDVLIYWLKNYELFHIPLHGK
jgi:hypothetical protein